MMRWASDQKDFPVLVFWVQNNLGGVQLLWDETFIEIIHIGFCDLVPCNILISLKESRVHSVQPRCFIGVHGEDGLFDFQSFKWA